jgi:PPOX class probable FMN-dependent enzyme
MATAPEHRIASLEALREIVVENPASRIKISDHLDTYATDFIARSPFLVLSTANAAGRGDASPKGDAPGFVWIEDDRTIVIPDRPGNKLAMGLENIVSNPHVGLLFMIPGTDETLRINGRAELSKDPALLERLAARGRPAVLAIRVEVDECFFHCAKAFIRSKLWHPDSWGERHRVSFGRMLADKLGADDGAARQIDERIESNYETEL